MKSLFNLDNPVMQFLSRAADIMLLNMLTLVCSLPIITAGAALSALHKVGQDIVFETEGGGLVPFFQAFRGNFKQDSGTLDKPIGRHPIDRKRMAVTEKNSKPAVTHWQLLDSYRGYSHILCRLETGRTHQIRVHMASIGHPLLGDFTYGAPSPEKGLEGQCLHARRLRFVHPRTGEHILLETELPAYFMDVLARLGPKI